MERFLGVWRNGEVLDQWEMVAIVRRFTLTCFESALRTRGLTEGQVSSFRQVAFDDHVHKRSDGKEVLKQHNQKNVRINRHGLYVYFKQFDSPQFKPYDRIMATPLVVGWLPSIYVAMKRVEEDRMRMERIYVGLIKYTQDKDRAHYFKACVQETLAGFGDAPEELKADGKNMVASLWTPSTTSRDTDLVSEIGCRMAAVMRTIERASAQQVMGKI